MKKYYAVLLVIFMLTSLKVQVSHAMYFSNNCIAPKVTISPTDFFHYSTYIGGLDGENINDACIDDDGCIYITGWTKSDFSKCMPDFSNCPGFDKCLNGDSDAFVLKLSPDGKEVLFITYIGGDKQEVGFDIEVNDKREIYVTGWTQSSEKDGFPIGGSVPGFDVTHNHFLDTFVIKLSPDGSTILFSTYIGGYYRDVAFAMDLDSHSNVVIAGWTESSQDDGFPIGDSIPGLDSTFNGQRDSFVLKLSADGTKVMYSTYFGGAVDEAIEDITIDSDNNLYITGWTTSSQENGFPIESSTPGIHKIYCGGTDAFIGKINITMNTLEYASYIGGQGNDTATCVAVDSENCTYIVGKTESSSELEFPINLDNNGFDKTFTGENDGFVMKFSSNGSIVYSSYIGGSYFTDVAYSIAITNVNTAYIVGWTNSSQNQQFPIKEIEDTIIPGYDTTQNGHFDTYLIEISQDGNSVLYSTFLGGSGPDFCNKVLVDIQNNIYIVGSTSSTKENGFPVGEHIPGFQNKFQGVQDGYVLKLKPIVPTPVKVKIVLHMKSKSASIQYSNKTRPIYKKIPVPPFMQNYSVYIPLRFIAETLHSRIQWEPKEEKITILHTTNEIYMWPNWDNNSTYNVEVTSLLSSVEKPVKRYKEKMDIVEGRTVLQLESFSRLFDIETIYNNDTETIILTSFLPVIN